MKKKILVIIGEASGDLHGGNVVQEINKIDPEIEFIGTGGKRFDSVSKSTYFKIEDLAVIGFLEVLKNYKFLKGVLDSMVKKLDSEKPDAVLLVDYVGFNLRFAEEAKKRNIPVFFYIAPQVWAWKKNRIEKMRKFIDHLIVLFPFEVNFFKENNFESKCFGHPLIEIAKTNISKDEFFQKNNLDPALQTISFLPGSRKNEILKHLETLLKTADELDKKGNFNFILPIAPTFEIEEIQPYLKKSKTVIHLIKGDTYNAVGHSDIAIVSSGTATLETAILGTPEIIIYKTSKATYLLGRHLFKIKLVGLPNILMKQEIMPEMIQDDFEPQKLCEKALEILEPKENLRLRERLKLLRKNLGEIGAYKNTAKYIHSILLGA